MDDVHNNGGDVSLVKGARDIAKEAKRQASRTVSRSVDRASDELSQHNNYNRFRDAEDEETNDNRRAYDADAPPPGRSGGGGGGGGGGGEEDEGASSDATEGHDDEDEIYEGEYQGVPPAYDEGGSGKARGDGRVALGQPVAESAKDRKELENERQADEEELAQQYELIMQECGHGRFQWQLFMVLGLALMSDGVEVFVVGFVLPSAETDMISRLSVKGVKGSSV
ncbi:hypothetical protein CRUP_001061 [Coryphaenoides rupestris]|nr:hypothetical protein CRUP_001061 [Coryphaenoides rupestris]